MLGTTLAPWPDYSEEEATAVAEVIRSGRVNYWTGELGRRFESAFADWCGSAHAVAVTNGTLALDLALVGLGIGARNGGSDTDEVIVTPRTFLASVSCVVNAGARPIFADVERDSGNISALTASEVVSDRTRAILPVHLAGWPCDVDPILDLAGQIGAKVIEDCAQAHGARYKGRAVGTVGDVGAWSFCQDKIMTTGGEGGMVTCPDRELWSRMWSFKDHGKSREAVYERAHPPGFRWLHESFGTNWRMLETQAAIGLIQLERMEHWTELRQANAARLAAAFEPFSGPGGPVRVPRLADTDYAEGSTHACYRFYAYVQPENLAPGWSRDRIVSGISDLGIPAMQGSCSEVYRERAFDGTGLRPDADLPNAAELGRTSIMMLVHPSLTEEQMTRSCAAVTQILGQAVK